VITYQHLNNVERIRVKLCGKERRDGLLVREDHRKHPKGECRDHGGEESKRVVSEPNQPTNQPTNQPASQQSVTERSQTDTVHHRPIASAPINMARAQENDQALARSRGCSATGDP
jgi:hypothetical protein